MGKRPRKRMAEHRRVHMNFIAKRIKKGTNARVHWKLTKAGARENAGGNVSRTFENPAVAPKVKAKLTREHLFWLS